MLPDCCFQAVEKSIWSGRSSVGELQGAPLVPSSAALPVDDSAILASATGTIRGRRCYSVRVWDCPARPSKLGTYLYNLQIRKVWSRRRVFSSDARLAG